MGTRIIISASSDIGFELGASWVRSGHDVLGTFREKSAGEKLRGRGLSTLHLDLLKRNSASKSMEKLRNWLDGRNWEVLVLAAGTMAPISSFRNADFNEWYQAFDVNFLAQAEILQSLLPFAKANSQVIHFAGAGTNSAAENYSCYSVSKIAGIKLFEILAAEEPTIKFTSIGPGWVKTKIHEETFAAGPNAGVALQATEQRFRDEAFFSMEKVIEAVDWIIEADSSVVSGRNFSAVNDPLTSSGLARLLLDDPDMFKLRRLGDGALTGG